MTPWEKHLASKKNDRVSVSLRLPKKDIEQMKKSRLTEAEFKTLYFGKPHTDEFDGLHSRNKKQ